MTEDGLYIRMRFVGTNAMGEPQTEEYEHFISSADLDGDWDGVITKTMKGLIDHINNTK